MIKEHGKTVPATVHYADLWGLRENKYITLSETDLLSTEWRELNPNSPNYFFVERDVKLLPEYEIGYKITDIFAFTGQGFTSSRDDFAVAFSLNDIKHRLAAFISSEMSDDDLRELYKLEDTDEWKLTESRKSLRADRNVNQAMRVCLYRPFDKRYCLLHPSIMDRPRFQSQTHMMNNNLAISTTRSVEIKRGFDHVLCTSEVMDRHAVSLKEINYLFPLYLYPAENQLQLETGRRPNLNPEFIKAFSEKLGLKFIEDGRGNLTETFGPEDIFNYAYAVFHSPTYRTRYAEFLKIDFPRLPLTASQKVFRALAEKGAELVALHLMESPVLNVPVTKYPIAGSNLVEKVEYKEADKRVHINKDQYFEGVPPEVWNFHVGGYQVCEKWLKDRKGRNLSYDDITHYQKIVVALKETIRLMAEIDQIIPGWPLE